MDEIHGRRRRLFSGAPFSSAIFHSSGECASFSYFSGCRTDGCYLVLKKNSGLLLAHEMNLAEARASCSYPVKAFGKNPFADLRKACGRGTFGRKAPGGAGAKGAWKVGFMASEMSAARFLALKKRAKIRMVDAGEIVSRVRGRKSRGEMKKIAAAASIAKKILGRLRPWKFGTEEQLALHLRMEALRHGCELAFEPIVATGKGSAQPHHKAGSAKLGDAVLVDFGVKNDGYCSDFTRCYFRRKGMPEQAAYEKCRKVYREILESLPACKSGKDVELLSGKLLKKQGLPKLIHAIGHGVGIEVHDCPHLGEKSRDSLEASVLALEPAAYFPGKFGVRYEGMVARIKGKWKEL
jgi:Xaa-Pro aminopeptidase